MRKITVIALLLFASFVSNSQTIDDVQAYYKLGGTRFLSLLSDHSLWWYSESTNWQKVSMKGLPESPVKFLDVYLKMSVGSADTRLVAVLQDNSIWWYADGASWEKVSTSGLPSTSPIKIFK